LAPYWTKGQLFFPGATTNMDDSRGECADRLVDVSSSFSLKGVRVMLKCIRYAASVPLVMVAAACSTGEPASTQSQSPPPSSSMAAPVAEDSVLKKDSLAALQTLYAKEPKSKELGARAKAVLVFPNLVKAGFLVGMQGGDGVLIENGQVTGVYNNTAVSYGLQAGVQSFGEAMFLMTDAAVNYLHSSGGWSIGMGPSIVVVDAGTAKSMTTTTLQSDVYAFIFGQQGLMAGLGLQGQKITRLRG
jgi:lipid-binding SYLF domain-containing protein